MAHVEWVDTTLRPDGTRVPVPGKKPRLRVHVMPDIPDTAALGGIVLLAQLVTGVNGVITEFNTLKQALRDAGLMKV